MPRGLRARARALDRTRAVQHVVLVGKAVTRQELLERGDLGLHDLFGAAHFRADRALDHHARHVGTGGRDVLHGGKRARFSPCGAPRRVIARVLHPRYSLRPVRISLRDLRELPVAGIPVLECLRRTDAARSSGIVERRSLRGLDFQRGLHLELGSPDEIRRGDWPGPGPSRDHRVHVHREAAERDRRMWGWRIAPRIGRRTLQGTGRAEFLGAQQFAAPPRVRGVPQEWPFAVVRWSRRIVVSREFRVRAVTARIESPSNDTEHAIYAERLCYLRIRDLEAIPQGILWRRRARIVNALLRLIPADEV